jgi:hypothetical protein
MAYVEELMKYMKVDSYGACLHNKVISISLYQFPLFPSRSIILPGFSSHGTRLEQGTPKVQHAQEIQVCPG